MLKNLIVIGLCSFLLLGCSRQQDTDAVYNKETDADFTTQPPDPNAKKTEVPALPGKAQIPGAPIQGYQTQTGSATAVPTLPFAQPSEQDSQQTQASPSTQTTAPTQSAKQAPLQN